eukprot:gene2246-4367_t
MKKSQSVPNHVMAIPSKILILEKSSQSGSIRGVGGRDGGFVAPKVIKPKSPPKKIVKEFFVRPESPNFLKFDDLPAACDIQTPEFRSPERLKPIDPMPVASRSIKAKRRVYSNLTLAHLDKMITQDEDILSHASDKHIVHPDLQNQSLTKTGSSIVKEYISECTSETRDSDALSLSPSYDWLSSAGRLSKIDFPLLDRMAQKDFEEIGCKSRTTTAPTTIASVDEFQRQTNSPQTTHTHVPVRKHQSSEFSVSYTNLSKWKMSSNEPEVQIAYLKAIKNIMLREDSLLNLKYLINSLDDTYWKYASLRIYSSTYKISNYNKELIAELHYLNKIQKELSVAIAHYRSITINVIQSIHDLRKKSLKFNKTQTSISIFWKQENYLLKMDGDFIHLFEYQVMKMWLGFDSNLFFLPPVTHQPKVLWEERFERFKTWVFRYNSQQKPLRIISPPEFIGNAVQMSSHISISVAATVIHIARRVKKRCNSVIIDIKNEENNNDNDGDDNDSTDSDDIIARNAAELIEGMPLTRQLLNMKALQRKMSTDELDSLAPFGEFSVSSRRHSRAMIELEPAIVVPPVVSVVEILPVETIQSGWKELRALGAKTWGTDEDPEGFEVWDDLTLNPFQVEAAVGLFEVFPTQLIVPELPDSLRLTCVLLERTVDQEIVKVQELSNIGEQSRQVRNEALTTVSPEDLENIVKDVEVDRFKDTMQFLQTRQLSVERLQLSPSTSMLKNVPQVGIADTVFLTAAPTKDTIDTAATATASPLQVSQSTYESIQGRVAESFRFTEVINGVRVLKPAIHLRRRRERVVTAEERYALIVKLQSLIRGHLDRLRHCRIRIVVKKVTSMLKVQRFIYKWNRRRRLRKERLMIRKEALGIRHKALFKRRAGRIIKRFMTWATYVIRKARENGLMTYPPSMRKMLVKAKKQELFNAASLIEHRWHERMSRHHQIRLRRECAMRIQMAYRRYYRQKRSHLFILINKINTQESEIGNHRHGQLFADSDDIDQFIERVAFKPIIVPKGPAKFKFQHLVEAAVRAATPPRPLSPMNGVVSPLSSNSPVHSPSLKSRNQFIKEENDHNNNNNNNKNHIEKKSKMSITELRDIVSRNRTTSLAVSKSTPVLPHHHQHTASHKNTATVATSRNKTTSSNSDIHRSNDLYKSPAVRCESSQRYRDRLAMLSDAEVLKEQQLKSFLRTALS